MEVLRRLRDAGNDVPVVIVTAHGSIPDAVQAMKLGAIDFLAKPLTPDDAAQVVAEVLARHAEASRAPSPSRSRPRSPVDGRRRQSVVDLTRAKRALNRRWFDEAEVLLEQAIDLDRDSAEAHTLMGVLHESLGQDHAAYHAYRAALKADPHYEPARAQPAGGTASGSASTSHNRSINPAGG